MSYVNMDHAGWVEMNNAAGKRMNAKRKPRRRIEQAESEP